MAYPDDLLGDDEQVVVHRHPHWKMLVLPVLVLFVVVGGGGYLAALAAPFPWHVIAWGVLAVVGFLVLCWRVLAPFMRWKTTHFVVTSQRIMTRAGVFTRTGVDIPLQRINSVQFRHDLIDRVLRCGTIVVESASDEPLESAVIPGVEQVHTLLYREVNAGQQREADEHGAVGEH